MNILNVLKNSRGAISKMGLIGTSVSVGLMGMSIMSYINSSPSAQEQQIRSLSSIMAAGGELPREYSGINISRGQAEFATAEERAKREGTLFDGGEGSVAALEGLKVGANGGVEGIGNIQGQTFAGGEMGLGMGANKVTEIAGNGQAAFAAQKGDVSGVDAATKGAEKEKGATKTLERASVARVSGGNGRTSFSGAGGFGGGSASRSAAQEKQNRINPSAVGASSISGAMPGGSTLVAATPKFAGAHSSSFVDPSGRRSRVASGINSEAGNSMRMIAVQSGKIAANAHRAANEGASPFMADTKLAAGIALDDGMVTGSSFGGTGDASFSQVGDKKIGDISAAIDEVDTTEQERKAKRTALGKELVALFFATIAAMCAISALMQVGELWSKAVAGVLGALMLVWIATYMARAGIFARDYDNDAAGIAFCVLGGVFAVGIAISYIPAVGQGIYDKILTPMANAMGGSATSLGAGGAISGGVEALQQTASGIEDLGKDDSSGLKNDDKPENANK